MFSAIWNMYTDWRNTGQLTAQDFPGMMITDLNQCKLPQQRMLVIHAIANAMLRRSCEQAENAVKKQSVPKNLQAALIPLNMQHRKISKVVSGDALAASGDELIIPSYIFSTKEEEGVLQTALRAKLQAKKLVSANINCPDDLTAQKIFLGSVGHEVGHIALGHSTLSSRTDTVTKWNELVKGTGWGFVAVIIAAVAVAIFPVIATHLIFTATTLIYACFFFKKIDSNISLHNERAADKFTLYHFPEGREGHRLVMKAHSLVNRKATCCTLKDGSSRFFPSHPNNFERIQTADAIINSKTNFSF